MNVAELIGPTAPLEVRAIAATTLFGSLTRHGTSAALGNTTDTALLHAVRHWADCVLVGAGTVRAEGYGSSSTPLAVVTRSLDLDTASPLFDGAVHVLTPQHSLDDVTLATKRNQLLRAGARLVSTGDGTAAQILAALRSLGHRRISCEGGPSLYAEMFRADAIDVLHLTVDPTLSGADGHPGLPLTGDDVRRFTLEDVSVDRDSTLFCRYRRARS